ncbi:MAG: PaaI family thioesterase [Bacillota bacterium]
MTETKPDYSRMLQTSAYWEYLGISIKKIEPGYAELVMSITPNHFQALGNVHGGAIGSLIDSAVAAALVPMHGPGYMATTIEMKVNYFVPVNEEGPVTAEAKIIQKGKKIAVGTVDVKNTKGRVVAFGVVTYMIIPREK